MKSATIFRFSSNQAYWPLPQLSARQSPSHQTHKYSLKALLSNLASAFVAQLTTSNEPRVWQSHIAAGHILWNAYDSVSDRIIRNASETEVRAWLEARHQC